MNRAERRDGLKRNRVPRGSRLIAVAVSTAVALATGLLVASPARAATPPPDDEYVVGDYPVSIAVNPAGTIAVTVNAGVSTATVIDLATGDDSTVALATQPDWRPRDVAIDPSGTYAYVTNHDSNSISRITLLDLTVTSVAVSGSPSRIVIDPAGVYAYVTVGASADRITLSNLTVDAGFLSGVTGPLVITSNGTTIYSYYTTAKRFDAATGNVTATFSTGAGNVTGAGLNSDQTAIFGVNDSGWVRKTDLTTLTTEVWASGLAGFNSSSWVSVGNNAYVPAINDSTLYKVDLLLPETVTTVASLLSNPMDVAVPVNGAFIVIASAGSDKVLSYNLAAPPTAPAFTAASPPSTGTVGTTYSTYSFTASGTTPITFTQASGTLPPGLTLASTGALSGTPTTAGTYTFTVSASNGVNPDDTTSPITITISSIPTAPAFTAASPPSTATVGAAYPPYSFTASGTTPITFTQASGTLPPGLTLASTGALSGTPTTAGTYTFTVSASNGVNPDDTTSPITITITSSSPPSPIWPPSPPREVPGVVSGVSGVAGDGEVTVSWTAPIHSGSDPVNRYVVTASPGGRTCTVTVPDTFPPTALATACTVTGLTNGLAYTFTVQAGSLAGLGLPSSPSMAVTPSPTPMPPPPATVTIQVTGTRDGGVVRVTGTTTGLGMGSLVTPAARTMPTRAYRAGNSVAVSTSGTFTWTRKVNPKKTLWVYFTAEGGTSNTLVMRRR